MQYHNRRSELWLFLSGAGSMSTWKRMNSPDRSLEIDLTPEADTYYHIPTGRWHAFKAFDPTWVLEIQYGEKCVEEDIVRV